MTEDRETLGLNLCPFCVLRLATRMRRLKAKAAAPDHEQMALPIEGEPT